MTRRLPAVIAWACLSAPLLAQAQPSTTVRGQVSVVAVAVPAAPAAAGADDGALELRTRFSADWRRTSDRLILRAAGRVDGLVADRTGTRRQATTLHPPDRTATLRLPA